MVSHEEGEAQSTILETYYYYYYYYYYFGHNHHCNYHYHPELTVVYVVVKKSRSQTSYTLFCQKLSMWHVSSVTALRIGIY